MAHLDDGAVWRYSARLCTEEEKLAIERHLSACPPCAERIEQDTQGSGQGSAQSGPAPSSSGEEAVLERGSPLGRYLVLHPVGQGGMGVVYAAYDPELNRKVAVKLLRARPEGSKPIQNGQARLLREAQAMARVSHPNVIAVHDVGTFGDRVFVAMELVEGTTLRTWLAEHKRGWREVLDAFVAAGRGLAAAHAAGLVHRDFKPENVLIGLDGRVRVTDFGLARLSSEESPSSPAPREGALLLNSPLTQAGKVVGTPYYMSPEQHRGVPPDARSDQFSFCAALYLALYGKRPFDPQRLRQKAIEQGASLSEKADTPGRGLLTSAATASLVGLPRAGEEPLIQEPPRDVRIPGDVRRAMLRGLSLRPEDRFASMAELLGRMVEPPGRVMRGWAALASLALVAAMGLTYRGWSDRQEALCGGASAKLEKVWDAGVENGIEQAFLRTGKPYAPLTWQNVRGVLARYASRWAAMHVEACQATRVRGDQTEAILSLRMGCLDKRLRELGALTEQLSQADGKVLDRALDAVNALPKLEACADLESLSSAVRPPDSPAAKMELALLQSQVAQAKALNEAGRYKVGLTVARHAVAGARELGYQPLLAEALTVQGWLQDHLDDLKGAEKSLVEAVWAAEAGRHDEAKVVAACSLVQSVGDQQGRPQEGHLWAGLARATLERLGRGHEELYVSLGLAEANMLAGEGRYKEALEGYQQALERAKRSLPPDHPWVASLYDNMGTAQAALGNRPAAVEALRTSVALNERIRGPEHPATALSHSNLAVVLLEAGDYKGALEHGQKALDVLVARLGSEHRDVAAAHNNVGTALAMSGRYGEALDHQLRALAIREKAFSPTHPGLSYPLEGAGYAYLQMGQPAEAAAALERALSLKNPDVTLLADTRFYLAQALAQLGHPRDRERTRALAVQAREAYLSLGKKARAAEVERFREHLPR